MAYKLQFYFEYDAHCVWSADSATKAKFGNPVANERLPISPELVDELNRLGHEFRTSLERLDRVGTYLWVGEPNRDFAQRARSAYERLQTELGEDFVVQWDCFDKCWYWLFSDDPHATFFRSRMEIPVYVVDQLNEEEREQVKRQIYERLTVDQFYFLYVTLLVYWKDKEAIPLLRQYLKNFRIRNRAPHCDFSGNIALCKEAIKQLKKVR